MEKKASLLITLIMVLSLVLASAPLAVVAEGPVFKVQEGGLYDGMPLFDGNPEHLDSYLDTYLAYVGLEGAAVYVTGTRNNYTLKLGDNAGKMIPGAFSAADEVQGVLTDLPAMVSMGQTWNPELLARVGSVWGEEKIGTLAYQQGTANGHNQNEEQDVPRSATVGFTVVSDLRINPLSGRFDEGFSEDPYLTASLINSMATGMSAVDRDESLGGFYLRAAVGTKHYSVYNSQWWRTGSSVVTSPRQIFEYHIQGPLKAQKSGAIVGNMTSFGRTNGIPNIISPYQRFANDQSPYGLYSSPDFNGDQNLLDNTREGATALPVMGNGYDLRYIPLNIQNNPDARMQMMALMALSDAGSGRTGAVVGNPDPVDLVRAVERGLYGLTKDRVMELARAYITQLVRVGLMDEVDDHGFPKYYPYATQARDYPGAVISDFNDPNHQDTALQVAREAIVLLKNDGTLPLDQNQSAAVSGIYANTRFKTQYSVRNTPEIERSGWTPVQAIVGELGAGKVFYASGARQIALKSLANNKYVSGKEGPGGILSANVDAEGVSDLSNNAMFDVYDWGQEGFSLLARANNRWVTSPSGQGGYDRFTGITSVGTYDIENNNNTRLAVVDNAWDNIDLFGSSSSLPPVLRKTNNQDGSVSLVSNAFATGFSSNFAQSFYTGGHFIRVDDGGHLVAAKDVIANKENAEADRAAEEKFEEITLREPGVEAADWADSHDYGLVFVGANVKHSASEGKDRSSLRMGEDDYRLVETVSAAFAAKNKPTVVVVLSNFPVEIQEIQDNPNVNAILYQSYGGQFDAVALTDILYGKAQPSGRLTATWYASTNSLPRLDSYDIPEGLKMTLDEIDPRYTVSMSEADPVQAGLTYMYTDKPVTYPFGYGLTYSTFEYKNLDVPADTQGAFSVGFDIVNTGEVDAAETAQVYIRHLDPVYGDAAAKLKLVGYVKEMVQSGQTKRVIITVDPQDFAIWDVNRGAFIVEEGSYLIQVGSSSESLSLQAETSVAGEAIGSLDARVPFNVADHAYLSKGIVYYEVSKARTAENLLHERITGGYYAASGKDDGSYLALAKVDLSGSTSVTAQVASLAHEGSIEVFLDSLESPAIAEIRVLKTAPVTRIVDGLEDGLKTTELGYEEVKAELSEAAPEGEHTLYLVFRGAGLRVDSLAFGK